MDRIDNFHGTCFTNFFIEPDGTCVECEFQAAKTDNLLQKKLIMISKPWEAKSLGNRVKIRSDWNDIRLKIMEDLVRKKFTDHPSLKEILLSTGNAELIEGNYWYDDFWGVFKGKGENHLGRILMKIREELKT